MSALLSIRGLSGLFAACAIACSHEAPPPSAPVPAEIAMSAPSAAATGSDVFVTLDTPIASYGTRTGQSVVATVDAPLRATNGMVLVAAGSTLRGHVVSAETAPKARVAIKFDSIQTVNGMAPINATVLDAGNFASPGGVGEDKSYDAILLAPVGPLASTGGGPPTNSGAAAPPVYQLFVPAGSKLHLMLTADLHGY